MKVGQLVKVFGFYPGVIKQVFSDCCKVAYVKEGKQIVAIVPIGELQDRDTKISAFSFLYRSRSPAND